MKKWQITLAVAVLALSSFDAAYALSDKYDDDEWCEANPGECWCTVDDYLKPC